MNKILPTFEMHRATSGLRTTVTIFAVLAGWMNLQSLAQPLATEFGWDPNTTCETDSVQFGDSTQFGSPPYNYFWDFGEIGAGDTSNLQHPKWGYSDTGTYTVQLIVTDAALTQDTFTTNIYISLPATAAAGVDTSVCEGSSYNLSGSIGGSASSATWSSGGDGTFDNNTLLAATYTPGSSDIAGGNVVLTLTTDDPAGACGPVNDAMVLTINPQPTISGTLTTCAGGATTQLTGSGTPAVLAWFSYSEAASVSNNGLVTGHNGGNVDISYTDVNGCSTIETVTIDPPAYASAGTDDVICEGDAIALSGTMGGSATSITWTTSGDGTFDDSTLLAATYTPGSTDIAGGSVTFVITTDDPAGPCFADTDTMIATINHIATASAGADTSICVGDNYALIGSIGGSASSSTWTTNGDGIFNDPFQLAATYTPGAIDISAGIVTITLTTDDPDQAGGPCIEATDSMTLTINPAVTYFTSVTHLSCHGSCDGTASTSTPGGTPPYTYLWDNAQTNATAVGLCAGAYTVTVTDSNGCQNVTTVDTLVEPTLLTASITGSTDPLCNGVADGSATVTAGGGTGTYTYSWSPSGGQSAIGTGLAGAIEYTATVTDSNGCTASDSITLTDPTLLTASIAGNDPTCNGASDGTAAVTATGGTLPYTYLWNTGATSSAISGKMAGAYSATVTDVNGCVATDSTTLTDPAFMATTLSKTDACNGVCDGTATASTIGGTPPYTYLWDDPAGQTAATAVGLCAGADSVIVTDSVGCTDLKGIIVNELTAIVTSMSKTDATCGAACDGTATVAVSGGTVPYTYAWDTNPSQTTSTATGLCGGTYFTTVTDANGCTAIDSAVVTDPAPITTSTSGVDASCNGYCDGTATTVPFGGTGAYTYSWDDPLSQTTSTATGLCAGTYTTTVTDANSCVTTDSLTISEPNLATTVSPVDVTCNGNCDGEATATSTGGAQPYDYQWDDPGMQVGSVAVNLCAGTYTVVTTDMSSCMDTATVVINEPTALTIGTSGVDASCNGVCDGSATVTGGGGIPPYVYAWNDPGSQTTTTAVALCAGSYTATLTDSTGCMALDNVVINQPTAMMLTMANVDATCGASNGEVSVAVNGGTGPYTYLWDDPGAQTTDTATALGAGVYNVVVTDAVNCTDTGTATVNNPGAATVTMASITDVTCNGGSDGSATVSATGGTPPYTYSWDDPGTQSNATATGLPAGSYVATVTDAAGCIGSDSAVVNEPAPVSVDLGPDTSVIDSIILDAGSGFTGYDWSTGATTQTLVVTNTGTYSVIVTDVAGCTATDSVVVTVTPSGPTATAAGTDASCNGGCDGTATGSATGGTPPYSYLWDDPNSQTGATASNLCAGSYMLIVADAASMEDTAYVTIGEPTAITTTTSSTDASCNGACDGTATTSPAGGTGAYTYSWSNAGTTSGIIGLCSGTYTVSIADAAGCSIADNVTVGEPTAIVLTTTSTDASCGNADGTATVNAAGGTGAYTYLWDDPATQTIATANALLAGSYTVVVTDASNCSNSEVAIVNDTGAPAATATSTDVSCNGAADGSATVTATGGTTPYTYSWDDPAAQTASNATNLAGGTYSVLVTDASGCIAGVAVTITEPAVLTVAATGTTVTACSNSDGTASAAVSGGTSPYTFSWSSGGTTQNVTGLTAGTHTVDVSDANGCTATDAVTIGQITAISVSISGTNVTSCGLSDGTAAIVITGGATPISVLWSTGETTDSISGLSAGLYTVSVIDSMGCAGGSTNILITEPPSLTAVIVGTDLSSCGAGDGSAIAAVAGGVAPYQYIWSNGDSTSSISGLPAGTHSVTIIDANGCTASDAVTLTEPAAFTTIVTGTDATCNLGTDGYADLTTTGGVSPFNYLWSNGDMLEDIGGLAAGTYYVDITDANGCAASDSVVINEPSAMVLTFTVQDASGCGATDGAASVSVTGGVSPYGYVWSNGDTTSTASNLGAGTHYLTLTDANECIAYGTINVNAATGPSVTVDNVSDVTCAGADDGSIDVTVTGGNPPYSYLWTHGATTEDVSGLQGTFYELTVTDSLGCVASASATVSEPTSLVVQTFTTEASCNAADGYAEVFATGGTPPYTYQWSTFGTSTSQSGLAAGSYTVNVIDANGCFLFTQISINSLGGPGINLDSINHVNCDYPSGGLIDLSVTGGTAPYNYAWSTGDTTEDLSNLIDTSYSVVVTDVNGCSAADNFDIVYLPPQNIKICIITVDSATGKNLTVWEKPTGPSSIENYYVYKEHTQAGVYFLLGVVPFDSLSVFVDLQANPQQRSWRYKITAGDTCISGVESELSPLHKTMHLTINQGLNGEVNLIWDKYDGFFVSTYVIYRGITMAQMDSLDAVPSTVNSYTDVNPPNSNTLFYEVSAVHPQGCEADKVKNFNSSKSNTSSISPSDAMTISVTGQDVSFGNCDGEAIASVISGGQAPFTYLWDDPLAQTTATAIDLCPGNYMVIITDALGDTITGNVVIGTLPSVLELNGDEWISAFPNPYTGQTTISYRLVRDAHVSLEVYDVLGKRVAVLADEQQQSGSYDYVFGSEGYQNPNGVYFVKLIANSKLHTKRIIELK